MSGRLSPDLTAADRGPEREFICYPMGCLGLRRINHTRFRGTEFCAADQFSWLHIVFLFCPRKRFFNIFLANRYATDLNFGAMLFSPTRYSRGGGDSHRGWFCQRVAAETNPERRLPRKPHPAATCRKAPGKNLQHLARKNTRQFELIETTTRDIFSSYRERVVGKFKIVPISIRPELKTSGLDVYLLNRWPHQAFQEMVRRLRARDRQGCSRG
jgi:hypothetical protein